MTGFAESGFGSAMKCTMDGRQAGLGVVAGAAAMDAIAAIATPPNSTATSAGVGERAHEEVDMAVSPRSGGRKRPMNGEHYALQRSGEASPSGLHESR